MTDLKRPVKRVLRNARVPYGVKPELILTLYPDGRIGFRELGRRREYQVDAGTIYARLVRDETAPKGRRKA